MTGITTIVIENGETKIVGDDLVTAARADALAAVSAAEGFKDAAEQAAADATTNGAAQVALAAAQVALAEDQVALADATISAIIFDETIGLVGNPATGTAPANNTHVFDNPVERTSKIRQIRLWAAATGTVIVRRFSKTGNFFQRVGTDLVITISSTGSQTLIDGTHYTSPTVLAGEYVGYYSAGAIARVATTGPAFFLGSGDVTSFTDSSNQTNISLQIGFDMRSLATDVLSVELDSAEARTTTLENLSRAINATEVIGLPIAPTVQTASSANSVACFANPVHNRGTVTRIALYAAASGNFVVKVFDKVADGFVQSGSDTTIAIPAAGIYNLVSGTDFTAIPVQPGQFLGFFVNSVPGLQGLTTGEPFYLGANNLGNASSFTDTTSANTSRFQVGFTVTPAASPVLAPDGLIGGSAVSVFAHPPFSVIESHDGYGQSWMDLNGNNNSDAALRRAIFPRHALMLNETAGINSAAGAATGLIPAVEFSTTAQSVIGPMVLRMVHNARSDAREKVIIARQSGVGGQTLAQLAEATLSFYNGSSTHYADWKAGVQKQQDIVSPLGYSLEVRTISWCHGAADNSMAYATYKSRLGEIFDKMAADVVAITGQRLPPYFLILQAPGEVSNANWENLQAQVDLALERDDVILGAAGWAFPIHDTIHFSTAGAILAGEMLALKAEAAARGQRWDSPYLYDVTRSGTTIRAKVGGLYPVIVDTGIATDRHQVSGSPVANFGFQYKNSGGTAITINSVSVGGRDITIELASATAGTLGFAWTSDNRGDNKPANRGTIRADWEMPAVFTSGTLRDWMMSGYWAL